MAFLRKLVRPRFPLSRLFPRFLSDAPSSKTLKIFSGGSFVDLRQESGYYLDKTAFISKIEDLNARAILSIRPRRFGKTLFLSTFSSYYDIKNRERFEQLFGDLYIGKNPTPLASSFLILDLNFAGLRTSETYDVFNADFHERLNEHMSDFMRKYQQELGHSFQIKENALANFGTLLNAVRSSGHKLYVCIDEYDAGMNEALKNEPTLQHLTAHHNSSVQSKIKKIESSFKQFYSRLKYACDAGIARVFQTGVTPVAMAEFTSGFNISEDLALRREFWDLHGFKKSEVELFLDNTLGLSSDVKEGITKWLKEENDGYFFNPYQTEGIFNPARILYCIKQMMEQKEFIDERIQDTSIIINNLLGFPPDPQTMPSQTTLDLIVNNPLGKSILTEALNQYPLESRKGIEQRFRLTNIRDLATDRTPLLSFLFYTGAITYQPNPSPTSLQHSFRIPNCIAKREFIAEALKIYDWKEVTWAYSGSRSEEVEKYARRYHYDQDYWYRQQQEEADFRYISRRWNEAHLYSNNNMMIRT